LVWGCFLLDFPWNRDPDCVTWHNNGGNGNHSGAVENQDEMSGIWMDGSIGDVLLPGVTRCP